MTFSGRRPRGGPGRSGGGGGSGAARYGLIMAPNEWLPARYTPAPMPVPRAAVALGTTHPCTCPASTLWPPTVAAHDMTYTHNGIARQEYYLVLSIC